MTAVTAPLRVDKWYAWACSYRLGRANPRWYMWIPALAGLGVAPFMILQYFATGFGASIGSGVVAVPLLNAFMPPQAAAAQSLFKPNLRALASATNVLMAGTFGAAVGPFATGVISDWLATSYALDTDSLRYAIGLSCLFATLGGLFFWRAARHFPEELSRNLAPVPPPRADNAYVGGVV